MNFSSPNYEGSKNIHVLKVLIWSFGGSWRYLTEVLPFDLDLYIVSGLWYTHDPNFEGAKNIHVLKVLI